LHKYYAFGNNINSKQIPSIDCEDFCTESIATSHQINQKREAAVIYLDNAATTSTISLLKTYHNPSSPHALGIKAERALRGARKMVTIALGTTGYIPSPEEVIFTSGGTEANNLAILGYTLANQRHGASLDCAPQEHPSILAPIRFAYEREWASANGSCKAHLLSITHVNHETGDINDINTIAAAFKKENPGAVIHIDGAQGFCKEIINLQNIDMYSISGHKCHGPTGTGALWVKKGIRLTPLQYGGGQEDNMRPGTENVSAIIQFSEAAATLTQEMQNNHAHVANLKSILLSLQDNLPDVQVNSHSTNVSPYILNISFLGIKGEILVHALSEKGIYASMGAACNSRKRTPSTLETMGFTREVAQSAIRFSFSPYNTTDETTKAAEIVFDTVNHLRSVIRK